MTIHALARTDVVTVDPEATILEVATAMADNSVGSVVVTEGETPLGIVTDRDLAIDVLGVDADPAEMTAREIMTGDLFTVDVDDGLFDVITWMREENVRRVPVMDGDVLAGIVTLDDFIVLLANELGGLADVIQSESPPYAEPSA